MSASSVTPTTAPGSNDMAVDFEQNECSDDSTISKISVETSTPSKRTGSRPEIQRGEHRCAKKRARAKAHYASLGKAWIED